MSAIDDSVGGVEGETKQLKAITITNLGYYAFVYDVHFRSLKHIGVAYASQEQLDNEITEIRIWEAKVEGRK